MDGRENDNCSALFGACILNKDALPIELLTVLNCSVQSD